MATVNLGRIKPVFRGAYSGSTAYVVDDIVTHGNESFICIQAHGAGTQATSVTAYWTKLAAKGADGSDIGTILTTQGDILYRDGSGLQRLAKGTAGQVLKINSGATAPEWGTDTGGKVLQVQYTAMVSGYAVSGTGLSDVTGYNVAITPSATSSKILVMANFSGQQGDYGGGFRLYRGSTFISQPTSASNRTLTHTSSYNAQSNATTTYSLCILDEPSTTSATTYKIVVNALSNTSYKVNESSDDSNSTDRPRTIATIVAMEIGA